MAKYVVNDTDLTAVANSIRAKTGDTNALIWPEGFKTSIASISGGGSIAKKQPKAVNFIDFDGTIIESYSKVDFLALTELPANPDHTQDEVPLTAQGWNWTLTDAQTYVTNYDYLTIGQNYVTTSGKATMVIEIEDTMLENRRTFDLCITQVTGANIYVDWGDGTEITTDASTSAIVFSHLYTPGRYIITFWTEDGKGIDLGDPTTKNNRSLCGKRTKDKQMRILKFYCSSQISKIQDYAFYNFSSLTEISLPYNISSGIDQYTFSGCRSLKALIFPYTLTSLAASVCASCSSMTSVSLPYAITTLNTSAFETCYILKSLNLPPLITSIPASFLSSNNCITKVIIPEGVTSLMNNAFSAATGLTTIFLPTTINTINKSFGTCTSLGEVHIKATQPPTLSASTVFTDSTLPSDLKIYVPYSEDHSVLDAYKAATNWSAVADKIYEEPQ